jgi:hypothetical protein
VLNGLPEPQNVRSRDQNGSGLHFACRIFTAFKAASHKSVCLLKDCHVRMSSCVSEVLLATPVQLKDVDVEKLKKDCVKLYNEYIILSHQGAPGDDDVGIVSR